MSRAPRYNKTQTYRIISMPGNLWQLQIRHIMGKGTKTIDPWRKAGHSLDLPQAELLLQLTNGE